MLYSQGFGSLLHEHAHGREELRRLWERVSDREANVLRGRLHGHENRREQLRRLWA
jgi:hypothetical protein